MLRVVILDAAGPYYPELRTVRHVNKAASKVKYVHGTSKSEQARLARLNEMTNRPFIEWLNIRPSDAVLEVGSGLGILAAEVAEVAYNGTVLGVESSAEQLTHRRGRRANLHFVRADAHQLPFAGSTFDIVYCRYVLEHVRDAYRVVQEAHRVLKPGGRFYTQENNIAVNLFYPECPLFESVWLQLGALQERLGADGYVGKKLFAYLTRAGFRGVTPTMHPEIHYAGMDSFEPWVENLIEIIEAGRDDFVAQGLLTFGQINSGIAEARAFLQRSDAAAYFYWNRAVGTK